MAKYNVTVNFYSAVNYEIEADSEEEARTIAYEDANPDDCVDFDCDVDYVELINEE